MCLDLMCDYFFSFQNNDESMIEDTLEETDHFINLYNNLCKCLTLVFNWYVCYLLLSLLYITLSTILIYIYI